MAENLRRDQLEDAEGATFEELNGAAGPRTNRIDSGKDLGTGIPPGTRPRKPAGEIG